MKPCDFMKAAAVEASINMALKMHDALLHQIVDSNTVYGHTLIRRYEEGQKLYLADCACGEKMLLTQREAIGKRISGGGCRSLTCTVETVREKLEKDFNMVLRFQHFLLLTAVPHLVWSWWGGDADDGSVTHWRVGCMRFVEEILATNAVSNREMLVKREVKSEPFISRNVVLHHLPDATVQSTLSVTPVSVSGVDMAMQLQEYSRLTGKDTSDILIDAFAAGNYEKKRIHIQG